MLKNRRLGSSGLEVSEVGLGCWQLGGDFGPIDRTRAQSIIETAKQKGVNFFDTADVYGAGQSERYLGEILGSESQIKIATKYGRWDGVYPDGYSLSSLKDAICRAQDRLQRDVIDLLQLHCIPRAVLERGEVFDFLREVKQAGLIGGFGASVETIAEALICLKHSDLDSLQIIFNLFRQNAKTELFEKAESNDTGIIVRLPLASGLLSGKFTKNTRFDPSDHRSYNKNGDAFSVGETFSGIEFEKALGFVKDLEAFKPDEYTMAQFAMRWILDHPAVSTIIPGASSVEQVTANVAVSDKPELPEGLREELYGYYKNNIEAAIRCEI